MRITYTGVGLFWIWLFVNAFILSAQEKLELSGKIRVLEPVEIRLENIKGEVLQKTVVKNNSPFSLQACLFDLFWRDKTTNLFNQYPGNNKRLLQLSGCEE